MPCSYNLEETESVPRFIVGVNLAIAEIKKHKPEGVRGDVG